ncbi:MAG: flagellar motor switch protein FliM [Planctomycetota bacterium]
MSANVEPEEVEAVLVGIADESRDAVQVESRDFRRPQRFAPATLYLFGQALKKSLFTLPNALEGTCGVKLGLSLASIGEVTAEGLFEDTGDEALLLKFLVDGQPGWMRWDAMEATALAEALLGSSSRETETRALTRLEERLVGEPLVSIVAVLAQVLGLETSGFDFAADANAAGTWRDGEGEIDSHRLDIELDITRAGSEGSTMHIYLPIQADTKAEQAPQVDLPDHMTDVSVEVCVQLATAEITLSQLLQLEVGDVIPTDVAVDDPAVLLVEDRPFARGHLGTHRGRFAVRLSATQEGGKDSQ